MRRMGRWIVLFALAWAATTAAYAAQAEMQPCAEAMRSMSMADCQLCVIGHAIPVIEKRMAESDDRNPAGTRRMARLGKSGPRARSADEDSLKRVIHGEEG
jgi:hypothetical protein